MIKKRIRNHANPFSFRHRLTECSIENDVSKFSDVDLEIGFGRGRFISFYAQKYPDRYIVGVEVRKKMVELFNDRML